MHESYMKRCFDLARLGSGATAPNPMVGAVLVHQGRILGEGFHRQYGGPHAEVEALRAVAASDRVLIPDSTLYVSLEPCNIQGKTPPCTRLIIEHKIRRVVLSCLDLSPEVSGNGVRELQEAGVEVITGILEAEGKQLSQIRNTFASRRRPYIVLKYARSADGWMGQAGRQVWLSNTYSRLLVHKWRSELAAILVGYQTARMDNPALNNRLYPGPAPLRIAFDRNRQLPAHYQLLDDRQPTWIFSTPKPTKPEAYTQTKWIEHDFGPTLLTDLLDQLYQAGKSSLLVEGGAFTLQSFIDQNLWDEARILETPVLLGNGIRSPQLKGELVGRHPIGTDALMLLNNPAADR